MFKDENNFRANYQPCNNILKEPTQCDNLFYVFKIHYLCYIIKENIASNVFYIWLLKMFAILFLYYFMWNTVLLCSVLIKMFYLNLVTVHSLPNLTVLSLSGCSKVTDEGVELIAENLQKLRVLDLSWCSRITDAALEYIACDLNMLEELTLDRQG